MGKYLCGEIFKQIKIKLHGSAGTERGRGSTLTTTTGMCHSFEDLYIQFINIISNNIECWCKRGIRRYLKTILTHTRKFTRISVAHKLLDKNNNTVDAFIEKFTVAQSHYHHHKTIVILIGDINVCLVRIYMWTKSEQSSIHGNKSKR